MLFVKTKESDNDEVTKFEVLTRSPFKGLNMYMEKYDFSDIFKSSKDGEINANISNTKERVYECIDKVFVAKLLWWEERMNGVQPLYEGVYEAQESKTSTKMYNALGEYKQAYRETFNEDDFTFCKDLRTFRALFNTAEIDTGVKGVYNFG